MSKTLELERENERLEEMIRQMHGMAKKGCEAPNAAYRWCERIDEVAIKGPRAEYAQPVVLTDE